MRWVKRKDDHWTDDGEWVIYRDDKRVWRYGKSLEKFDASQGLSTHALKASTLKQAKQLVHFIVNKDKYEARLRRLQGKGNLNESQKELIVEVLSSPYMWEFKGGGLKAQFVTQDGEKVILDVEKNGRVGTLEMLRSGSRPNDVFHILSTLVDYGKEILTTPRHGVDALLLHPFKQSEERVYPKLFKKTGLTTIAVQEKPFPQKSFAVGKSRNAILDAVEGHGYTKV